MGNMELPGLCSTESATAAKRHYKLQTYGKEKIKSRAIGDRRVVSLKHVWAIT